ncbi:MAG: ferritin-like domain-containing protein [Sulfobacillus sp.]|nr:ferritin-like domain-containing protein [Sulfobacillus sp.]
MVKNTVVALLNEDFRGEHAAIVHYLTHAWTVAALYGPAIEAIARDEMRHMKWLGHSIVALGGVPDLTVPELPAAVPLQDALRADIEAEQEAIRQYEDHRARIADPGVKSLLTRIMVDEQDHLRQFEAFYAVSAPSAGEDPTESPRPEAVQRLEQLVAIEYREILRYLFQSFITSHAAIVGLTAEDHAVEEMRHLDWVASALVQTGGTIDWSRPVTDGESTVYESLQARLDGDPTWAGVFRRIHERERLQTEAADGPRWTVGSLFGEGTEWTS